MLQTGKQGADKKYLDKMFKIYFVYFGNSKSVKYKWKIYND